MLQLDLAESNVSVIVLVSSLVHYINKVNFSRLHYYMYTLGRAIHSLSQLSMEYSALNTDEFCSFHFV